MATGCSGPEPSKDGRPVPVAVASASGRFVGSEACRDCHLAEYTAWQESRHKTTLRPWSAAERTRLAGRPLPAPFQVGADGTVSGPSADGKTQGGRIAFLVGGRRREDLFVKLDDGRTQVFPVSLDLDAGQPFEPLRELAGGVGPPPDVIDFWTRAGRNADLACYGCHATGQVLESSPVLADGVPVPASRWAEPGVGCEACHGPGGAHAAAAAAKRPSKALIRLPRGTPAAMSVDTCAGCHALREVLPSPFGATPAHRYGEPMEVAADPALTLPANFEFHDPIFANLRPATYQQEAAALAQTSCVRRGGLTCAGCHDPHSGALAPALGAADGGDSVCAACHSPIVRAGASHTMHPPGTPGGRCLDCHMPAVLRGPGRSPARDHTLSPPVAAPGQIADACVACHAGGKNAAAVSAAWKKRAPGPAARAREALGDAMEGALAGKYEAAETLASVARDTAGASWIVRYATITRLGQTEKAPSTQALRDAVRGAHDDPNPSIRRAAARALGHMADAPDLERLSRAADDSDVWAAVEAAQALTLLGSKSGLTRLARLAERPDVMSDARAQAQIGRARLIATDGPGAEAALRRALQINPMMVSAMNDLGLALMSQGKRDEALAAWRRALAINPRFAPARDNLDAIVNARR